MDDRVQRLREAAQARHEATLRRAENTLRQLATKGGPITFRRVAEEAGVSRAWLYRQHQLRDQIDQLRGSATSRASTIPPAERATIESLRQRLRAYRSEIARLRLANQELRGQLARQLGAQRAAANTSPRRPSKTCPQRQTSQATAKFRNQIKRTPRKTRLFPVRFEQSRCRRIAHAPRHIKLR